jgi:hypothetical protein
MRCVRAAYAKIILTESEKRMVNEDGAVFLTGIIQAADKKNGNGRVYP